MLLNILLSSKLFYCCCPVYTVHLNMSLNFKLYLLITLESFLN